MIVHRWVVAMVTVLGFAGCGAPQMGPAMALLPTAPGDQAKCRVATSQQSPLVTEWPASEKANLEAMSRLGAVVVAYSGCSMRVLTQCRVRGQYFWQRTTPSADVLEITTQDDLYAKLPLGAASLEGELARSGRISVRTVVAGSVRLGDAQAVAGVPLEGECAQATHVVGAISLGAFSLAAGGELSGKGSVDVTGVGSAGGGVKREVSLLRSAGDADSCGQGTDAGPHPNCGSPVQVYLWPIPGRGVQAQGPPGTVDTSFVSGDASARWDVYIDDVVVCTTPCQRWVNPGRPVLLRTRDEGFMRAPDRVRLSDLGGGAHGGAPLQVVAEPTASGQLAAGITFTTFGGLAVITGITLTAVGCSSDRSGMCTGGIISGAAGAVVTVGAIWLILDALPKAKIRPVVAGALGGLAFEVGPLGIRGSF